MRVVLAFLVMGWMVNLIFALASHDALAIAVAIIYLGACAYGVFVRGVLAGLICWIGIGIGVEVLAMLIAHAYVPAVTLLIVLFWSALAIFAGNLFSRE